jgi:hypothetical protein
MVDWRLNYRNRMRYFFLIIRKYKVFRLNILMMELKLLWQVVYSIKFRDNIVIPMSDAFQS